MNDRSFVVTIAYIKTEAIQAAIFGLLFLGDRLTLPILVAVIIATAGVVLMSFKSGAKVQGGLTNVTSAPTTAWAAIRPTARAPSAG